MRKILLACLIAIALTACGCAHPLQPQKPESQKHHAGRHGESSKAPGFSPGIDLRETTTQLLKQLSSDKYNDREEAQTELEKLLDTEAGIVLPCLLKAYETCNDPEVKTRLEAVPIIRRHLEFGITAALLAEFPDVVTQARSPKAQTRRAIVEKLGNAKKSDAEVILLKALEDRNKQIYLSAIKALGSIGSTKAVEPLLDRVRSAPTETRIALVEALGEIGDPRAVEPLLEVFMEPCGDILTWAVGEALEEFADPRSVETCIQALKKITTMKYGEAIDILASIGKPAVKALVEALKKEDWRIRDGATKALVRIGKPAVKSLVKSLESSNPDIRYAAVRALGEIKDERGVGPLIKALRDKEYSVAQAAAEALKKITKQNFGKDHDAWEKWYEESKEK